MLDDFLTGLLKKVMTGDSGIDSKWLQFGGSENETVMTFIRSLWNYLAIIGLCLTLIYFIIELNQKLAIEGAQNMTMKSFMAPFLKLAIAVIVLHNGANITLTLLSVNDTFVNWAAGNSDIVSEEEAGAEGTIEGDTAGMSKANAEVYTKMSNEIADLNIVEGVIVALVLLLAYLVSCVISLVWAYKAICYKIEVLYRLGITPVALADTYSGQHSNALKWLKGFIGLALYAMAIIILPKLANLLGAGSLVATDGGLWGVMKGVFIIFVAPFAALGVAGTVKQMCKEALG
ncbi:MAG: hypothetical protein IJK26_09115 [Clostridia bacterium]|nr:hypothetical protein [Clostridia bacterium]